jgi:hypothetical protein
VTGKRSQLVAVGAAVVAELVRTCMFNAAKPELGKVSVPAAGEARRLRADMRTLTNRIAGKSPQKQDRPNLPSIPPTRR